MWSSRERGGEPLSLSRRTELSAKSQIWFNIAKNNEAAVCNLRSAVDQVLLQNVALAAPPSADHGDCGPADDVESYCYGGLGREPTVRQRTACRVCGEKEVCVLILSCNHICLFKDCEPSFDTCSVCHTTKVVSLQAFLSGLSDVAFLLPVGLDSGGSVTVKDSAT